MTLWLLGACVSRSAEDGKLTFGHLVSHHVGSTEGAARTEFVAQVQSAHPGYAINDMTCTRVPLEDLWRAIQPDGAAPKRSKRPLFGAAR